MSNMKHCPRCHCSMVIKFGVRNGRQRYRCKKCNHVWQNKGQPERLERHIWKDFAVEDMRIKQLCQKYCLGKDKVRDILNRYQAPPIIPSGKHDVIGMDCTYFGKRGRNAWGLLIILDLRTKECLYCEEIPGHETYAHYCIALDILAGFWGVPKSLRDRWRNGVSWRIGTKRFTRAILPIPSSKNNH